MSAFALPRLPPLSAIVSICLTPPPPFVSHCQHSPNPFPPLSTDIICEQPLTGPTPSSFWKLLTSNIMLVILGEYPNHPNALPP